MIKAAEYAGCGDCAKKQPVIASSQNDQRPFFYPEVN